jgi:hypothetical protein
VRRGLLEWIPEKVTAPDEDLLDGPETMRTLLRYLDTHGLRDPRGAAIGENESAIDAVAAEFADAIGDQERYGLAKTVAMSARDRGLDIGDPEALTAFPGDVRDGRLALDEDLLGRVLERQFGRPAPGQERKFVQLPVSLPARRNSLRRPDAARLLGSFVPSRNGSARRAGRSRRPGT